MSKVETFKLSELDASTGKVTVRDLTTEEAASFASATQVDFEAHLAATAAARESRRAKLLALGLTEEELDA